MATTQIQSESDLTLIDTELTSRANKLRNNRENRMEELKATYYSDLRRYIEDAAKKYLKKSLEPSRICSRIVDLLCNIPKPYCAQKFVRAEIGKLEKEVKTDLKSGRVKGGKSAKGKSGRKKKSNIAFPGMQSLQQTPIPEIAQGHHQTSFDTTLANEARVLNSKDLPRNITTESEAIDFSTKTNMMMRDLGLRLTGMTLREQYESATTVENGGNHRRKLAETARSHMVEVAKKLPKGHPKTALAICQTLFYLVKEYEDVLSNEVISRKNKDNIFTT